MASIERERNARRPETRTYLRGKPNQKNSSRRAPYGWELATNLGERARTTRAADEAEKKARLVLLREEEGELVGGVVERGREEEDGRNGSGRGRVEKAAGVWG